jgi:hypothetical protein
MMSKVAPLLVSAGLALATAWLSFAPAPDVSGDAVIRLSWRTQPIRVEQCRTLGAEELEALAAHMRQPEECTGAFAEYELRLVVDGAERVDTIAPSGLRRDRPIYVFRDEAVATGAHTVSVRFAAIIPDGVSPVEPPAVLEWSGSFDLAPYEIALITQNSAGSSLLRR